MFAKKLLTWPILPQQLPMVQATAKGAVMASKGTQATQDMMVSKVSTATTNDGTWTLSCYVHCLCQQLHSVRWEVTHRIQVDMLQPVDVLPIAPGQTIVPVSSDRVWFVLAFLWDLEVFSCSFSLLLWLWCIWRQVYHN